MQRYTNKHRRDISFSAGDLVYVSTANLRMPANLSRKLAPLFVGPFKVLTAVGNVSYKVELPIEFKAIHNVFHVSQLKLHQGAAPIRRDAVFVPATVSNEFEVDCIVAKRLRKNQVEYLVHWKGYSAFDDTWEPI